MASKEQAKQFVENARSRGWSVELPRDNDIITIFKHFEADNVDAFVECDGEYYSVLAGVPITGPGSMWGTDGGGVGAIGAIKRGLFRMNRSGVSKRFGKAVREYLIQTPDLNIDI